MRVRGERRQPSSPQVTGSKVYKDLKQRPGFALLSLCTIIPYIAETSPQEK